MARRHFRQSGDERGAAAGDAHLRAIHLLSLRFHLERKTGGLTRVLERGRNAIETIVRMVLLQLAPTIVELVLIVAVLLLHFDWRYVAVIGITVALYMGHLLRDRMAHRYPPQDERERHRRQRQGDRSLLNYETVKYFSAENRETRRYDHSMARYEKAASRPKPR